MGHKLDKERAKGNRDKGKDGKLIANLIPGDDQQGNIQAIVDQRKRNFKAPVGNGNGRNDLRNSCYS